MRSSRGSIRLPGVTMQYSPPASAVLRRASVLALVLSTAALAGRDDGQSPSGRNFSTIGGNLANHRYSSLTRITKSNLSKLGGAWSIHLEDGKSPGTMQATPIVVDGVMFIASGAGNIFAIDAATGAIKWKHETTLGGTLSRRGRRRRQSVFAAAATTR